MKLALKNIGKLESASIEISGITIIAGANNTGKSTVGKALFSIFNGLYNIDKKIEEERNASIARYFGRLMDNYPESFSVDFDGIEFSREIIKNTEYNYNNIYDKIVFFINNLDDKLIEFIDNDDIETLAHRIISVLEISDSDFLRLVVEKSLIEEFNNQINNLFSKDDGQITLTIKNNDIEFNIINNTISSINKILSLSNEVIYIDDPFIIDEMKAARMLAIRKKNNHRLHLVSKLLKGKNDDIVNELVTNQKLHNIYKKISTVCDGDIYRNRRFEFEYHLPGFDASINIANLSTGLKTFAILKLLLQNGVIEYNGVIILDEPEIHLHPEWQLLFAELIVLLHKEFNMHILLNSHSPYFINAIEVYSAKYLVANKCKYYLTEEYNKKIRINDVTECIELIYKKLAKPFQVLENEKYDKF